MRILFIAVAVVFCLASLTTNAEKPANGSTHVVKFEIINGKLNIEPEALRMKPGDRVVWIGPSSFEISFPETSPFTKSHFTTSNSVVNQLLDQASANRFAGKNSLFKYDIIVDGVNYDPFIIIDH